MKKENLMPAVVLTAICLVVAVLLAGVNLFTAPKIAAAEEEAFNRSLSEALPGGTGFEKIEYTPEDGSTVVAVYKETSGAGYVVSVKSTKGYTGKPITMTVGIANGEVKGAVVTKTEESKINNDIKAYPGTFVGKNSEAAANADTVSGVTFSSKAYRTMITDALNAVDAIGKGGEQ